eukprot:jgi/Botrbrau1/16458/Bobra.0142s0054.1
MLSVPHFETGQYQRNNTFLEDDEYSRALDSFVKGCVDLLLTDESSGEVLLMKRKIEPQPDWWFVGGRLRAGDSPTQGGQKIVKRELGIDLAPGRFKYVLSCTYLWEWRQQEPQRNGTADMIMVFTAAISPEERAAIVWDTAEYDNMRWQDLTAAIQEASYHPALRRALQGIKARETWEALERAVEGGPPGDAHIAAVARAAIAAEKKLREVSMVPVSGIRLHNPGS